MTNTKVFLAVISLVVSLFYQNGNAQEQKPENNFFKDRKLNLNEDGSNYVKFTFLTQAWLRSADYNPGTTINDVEKNSGTLPMALIM